MSASKEELQQKSIQLFDHVVASAEQNGKKHLEAMFGRAKVFEKAKKYESAVDILSETCICFPNFLPSVIEKAKLHHQNGEFEQSLDAIL